MDSVFSSTTEPPDDETRQADKAARTARTMARAGSMGGGGGSLSAGGGEAVVGGVRGAGARGDILCEAKQRNSPISGDDTYMLMRMGRMTVVMPFQRRSCWMAKGVSFWRMRVMIPGRREAGCPAEAG